MATEKRLIDVWNLIEWIDDFDRENTLRILSGKKAKLLNSHAIKTMIFTVPRVDAVEVVHGWWVIEKRHTVSRNPYMDDNYHAHATCSECGFCIHSENASFGYPELKTTNYCPNCGADMRGDGNDI